jgi:hypothetical protein
MKNDEICHRTDYVFHRFLSNYLISKDNNLSPLMARFLLRFYGKYHELVCVQNSNSGNHAIP